MKLINDKGIIDRIVQHIRDRPDLINHRDKMILGDGWDQTLFESKKFPSAVSFCFFASFNFPDMHFLTDPVHI